MTTYKMNEERNGVEIYFEGKPDEETRNLMKANGFRWGRTNMCWYAKQSDKTIALAKNLSENNLSEESSESNVARTYPAIDIEDILTYTIDQQLQDREHDSAWIFRKNKRDHNKGMHDLFSSWNEDALSIISKTENEYYIFKIKETLQRYKKLYHTTYTKYLSHKANNPSWAVTGRGGMNVRRYNKQMERQETIMKDLANIPEEFENRLQSYYNKIRQDKVAEMNLKSSNTIVDIEFKTQTKEFTYMNSIQKKRVYVYQDYWICKLWGCFRIFKGSKEIHSMRTKDRLDVAKQYACMLIKETTKEQAG